MEQDKKTKTSRASQTRVKQERPKVWTPPSHLMHRLRQTVTDTDGYALKVWALMIQRTCQAS